MGRKGEEQRASERREIGRKGKWKWKEKREKDRKKKGGKEEMKMRRGRMG